MKTTAALASLFALFGLLSSCGGGGGGSSGEGVSSQAPTTSILPQNEETSETADGHGEEIDGHYLANFTTLNGQINGTIPGSVTFFKNEDKLQIYLRLFAGQPQAWHQQKIYTGNRCPTMTDDLNGDGVIDITEAEAVLGNIIVPLDADISSQASGKNFYPVADLSGSYYYERIVNFTRFLADLQAEDKTPTDNTAKLAPGEPFNIVGRPVLVQGVTEATVIPETVASGTTRHRAWQTLPIACGTFQKVTTTPGRPDDSVIPGPVADVQEGQDLPSPDDGFGSTGTGTGTGTGGGGGGGSNSAGSGDSGTRDEDGNSGGSENDTPPTSDPTRSAEEDTGPTEEGSTTGADSLPESGHDEDPTHPDDI
jgi:hypothetical protein